MTNDQMYKTVEARQKAFEDFCRRHICGMSPKTCQRTKHGCLLEWLVAECEDTKQDLPFEIRTNSGNPSRLFPFALFSTVEYGKLADKFIVGLPENYYHDELCDRLNAAALAWHKQMVEKEGK